MTTPLSRVIQARMTFLEMSKEDLADRSRLGRSTIYAFVAGTRTDPQGSTLRKLAEGLHMTPDELVRQVNGVAAPAAIHADPRIARILELLPGVPPERLDTIASVVALAVQPARGPAKRRGLGSPNRLLDRRAEIRNGTDDGEEIGSKRRQFDITGVSTWLEHVVDGLLAAFSMNRDSGITAPVG